MLKPIAQYLKDEGLPRWRQILITPEALISILVVASFIKWGGHFFASSPKISDLTTGLIAYGFHGTSSLRTDSRGKLACGAV